MLEKKIMCYVTTKETDNWNRDIRWLEKEDLEG